MGLFSRSESAAAPRRPVTRASTSGESLAQELRGRARRRLVGALVLVLAAIVIVPMLLDSTPAPKQANAPLPVPAVIPPASSRGGAAAGSDGLQPSDGTNVAAAAPNAAAANAGDSGSVAQGAASQAPEPAAESGEPMASAQSEGNPPAARTEPSAARNEARRPDASAKPESHAAAKPKPEARHEARSKGDSEARTDDGSVAIALLEGRKPGKSAPAPSARGNFVLQIAAYTSDKDAQSRREKLAAAGVTNAYVEAGSANGKPTYRLRVGPFPTRDAAQAAQARLRALGYDNGFISTK